MRWFIAAVLAVLFFYDPSLDSNGEPKWMVCGFHWLTGLECPLCGMTRALLYLVKGRLWTALQFHALSPLVLAILLTHLGPRTWWRRIPWKPSGVVLLIFGCGRLVWRAAV